MTIREIISWVDEVKPNAFTDAVKVGWLNDLEGLLIADVFLLAPLPLYSADLDMDTVPLVDPPHDALYIQWLTAKVDEANGEYDRYMNTLSIYNVHFDNFVCWFANTYAPAQGYNDGLTRSWHPYRRRTA